MGNFKDECISVVVVKFDDVIVYYDSDEKSGEGKKELFYKVCEVEYEVYVYMEKYEKMEMVVGML